MTFVATMTTDTKTIANPTWDDVEREIGALDAKTQTFSYQTTFYFKGGDVDARAVYRGVLQ